MSGSGIVDDMALPGGGSASFMQTSIRDFLGQSSKALTKDGLASKAVSWAVVFNVLLVMVSRVAYLLNNMSDYTKSEISETDRNTRIAFDFFTSLASTLIQGSAVMYVASVLSPTEDTKNGMLDLFLKLFIGMGILFYGISMIIGIVIGKTVTLSMFDMFLNVKTTDTQEKSDIRQFYDR